MSRIKDSIISNNNSVNWNQVAKTEAVFKHFEDNGRVLKVYIDGQENPIKCTSGHIGDYQKSVEFVKDLHHGEKIMYWSRGVNVYSPKEWFYKIERI